MAKFSETQAEVEESSIMECLHEKLSFSQRLQDMSRGLKIQIAVVLCFLLLGVLYFADRPQGRAKKRINCVVGDSIPISSDPLKENSRFANEPSVDVGLPAYLMNDLLRAFRDGKADGYVLRTTLGVYEAQLFQDELVFQTQAEYLFEASGFEQIYAEHSHVCLPFRFIKTDMVIDSGSDRQFRAIFKSEAEEDVVWALKGSCFAYKTGRSHELIPFLYLDDPSVSSTEPEGDALIDEEPENSVSGQPDSILYDRKNPDSPLYDSREEYLIPVICREDSTRSIQIFEEGSFCLQRVLWEPVKVRIED